ncbi:MAG: hypothetical protein ACK56F_04365, partial [bacterium]
MVYLAKTASPGRSPTFTGVISRICPPVSKGPGPAGSLRLLINSTCSDSLIQAAYPSLCAILPSSS